MLASLAAVLLLALPADPETAAVEAAIDRMHAAASAADGPTYFAQFTADARFIGTDATEHWPLADFRAYAEPYFARGRGWAYVPRDRVVTIAPIDCRCVAWFDEKLTNSAYGDLRGSGVLRLTDDGWKIEQYVLSLSVPNDRAGRVVEVIAAPAE
ncbi:MAG: nuclear transport factor 2 family protein [Alphaproteobacteria bacterium]|nr:nuclear transport factor 2 family protein [Alphaproteobacteria bacterium]MBU1525729.1 nuclear transport factor 2 family protein [Alphaproteobacteria bacterium]MBU2117592.1 nuclear transport factor 2 family protein [Alphaproteobacteria bacterium]MBU2351890.1 nuclear transport factor 2 family protein [Alphaproteobacteria bacterium]MBU2382744.1 nuclear transport factor 2 family protein [Alphaproteobacteria bacterium]